MTHKVWGWEGAKRDKKRLREDNPPDLVPMATDDDVMRSRSLRGSLTYMDSPTPKPKPTQALGVGSIHTGSPPTAMLWYMVVIGIRMMIILFPLWRTDGRVRPELSQIETGLPKNLPRPGGGK